jgi:nucleotide-binding universal stress UspA family protein
MGSHHAGALGDLLLGAATTDVIRHAGVPVMLVK